MPLDGAFVYRIKEEIEAAAIGARVDKIAQPTRDELILHLRRRGDGGKLLLSAGANNARAHFTESSPENPKAPPMFCMLLRKHLTGAKLTGVRQIGMDRVLLLDFETRNELGDLVTETIAAELMGRHSNLILIGPEGKIIDSIRRVDLDMSSVRQVLPGMRYELPPPQDKLNLLESDPEEVVARVLAGKDVELSKALMNVIQGLSPLVSRELARQAIGGLERTVAELENHHIKGLRSTIANTAALLKNAVTPVMLSDRSGRPKDFSYMPIAQYGELYTQKEFSSCGELLDAFYAERDLGERMKQRAGDLLKLLAKTSDRLGRKLAAQRQELIDCADREQLKIRGDLIHANLYALEKGMKFARLVNFYDENQPEIDVELDEMLTPVQNAQRYYLQYRKADTAEKKLVGLIEQGEGELLYIDSVFDALARATTEAELDAIRAELEQGGYARRQPGRKRKEEKLAPLRYRSDDGFLILTGRNNLQNDRLTLKDSHSRDIWLHTQKIPGSHTIIVTEGRDVPKSTIEQACIIAAYNSKARESSKVPVDFALVKHVKKPSGAKPGMVIYDHYETVIVDPDAELAARLAGEK